MKNTLKRLLSFCLVLAMTIAVPVTAYATDSASDEIIVGAIEPMSETADQPVEPDFVIESNEQEIPAEPEPVKLTFDELPGNTIVGKMYICSQSKGLGHAWIYIENYLDIEVTVGAYRMNPYGSISVGTFLFTRADGMGVYYNVERYCGNKYGLRNQAWLGMEVTKDQILKVTKEIKAWNYWDPYFNCTFFAAKVWNAAGGRFIMPMMFPALTTSQIKTNGGTKDVNMQNVDASECFKQKGMNGNAKIEPVKERTLKNGLG